MGQVATSDMMLDSILDIHSLRLPSGKRHLEQGRLFAWENEKWAIPKPESSTGDGWQCRFQSDRRIS